MDLILTGFIAGVLGTLMMDPLNHLIARYGVISKKDVRIVDTMAVGWGKVYSDRKQKSASMVRGIEGQNNRVLDRRAA